MDRCGGPAIVSEDIRQRLEGKAFVLTGAGISAASGLPTFRGSGGLYEGLNPYELATPEAFRARPVTVWNWYLMRIHGGISAEPNAAHLALVELERRAEQVTIVTSNVDPLHERAGSSRVYKLHGNILQTLCSGCAAVDDLPLGALPEQVDEFSLFRCSCGALLRPNVVWFGEYPWPDAIEAVRRELPQADVVLEVGSSGVVSYGFSESAAALGIPVLRINPEPESCPGITCITGPAEVVLPELLKLG